MGLDRQYAHTPKNCRLLLSSVHIGASNQGDRIGRIFAYVLGDLFIPFGIFSKITEDFLG
jgi:hypothetical protein